MDNPDIQDFPEYFFKLNEHMILIQVTDDVYTLVPPNQCDWFYTLSQIDNNTWNVKGAKDDTYHGSEKCDYNYILENNEWKKS
jgi:hypothetical protein